MGKMKDLLIDEMNRETRLPVGEMNIDLEVDALDMAYMIEDLVGQPDIGVCAECGEHAEFDCTGSECCGADAYDSDPDVDMER